MLANQPGFLPGHMLGRPATDTLGWTICNAYPHGCKAGRQATFGPATPTDPAPCCRFQYLMGRDRLLVRYRMHPGWAALSGRKHQLHIGGIDFLMAWYPDCPAQAPRTQGLTERGGQAITGIRKNTAKTDTCGTEAINLFDRHLRFGPGALMFQWNTSPIQACRICCPDIGQEQTE
ncbi:hypothetical protein JCM25156A_30940 [Komagataeibacter kakiaceti JCM 25156]